MAAEKIRIAILCRGCTFDAWEAESIRQVLSLPFAEVVLLVQEPSSTEQPKGFSHKLANYPYRHLLWRVYKRFRLRIPAYRAENLENELKNVPRITCAPELKGKYSQHFSGEDLSAIRSHRPDVILRFAYNILRGEILTAAKYGVWSFHHADPGHIRGGPAAFWEIHKKHPVTGAILQRLTEKLDAGIVLRSGFFQTIPHSYKANLQQLLWGTTSWMKQALIDVYHGHSPAESGLPLVSSAKVFTFPTNSQMLRAKWIAWKAKLKFHHRELFRPEQWNIGIIRQSPDKLFSEGMGSLDWLPDPPAGEYYADPFGWKENGELKIVFEHYFYAKPKGVIAIADVKGNVQTLLAKNDHLSYPFVLETNNKRFLVPECNESGKVFTFNVDSTEEKKLLGEIAAIDPTLLFFNGRWWLFCTLEGDYNNTELHIYHAQNFEGPWQPHANNPVKCDIRSSRPAGTPFLLNGKLCRPAQDCSSTYGAAVVINEIVTLSETDFFERPVKRLGPHPQWKFGKGLHTFSVVDGDTVLIDAKRYVFNFDNFSHVMRRKLRRLFRK